MAPEARFASDDHGLDVREMETHELMAEFEILRERLEWVVDEMHFRFDHDRLLEDETQKTELAELLNQYND